MERAEKGDRSQKAAAPRLALSIARCREVLGPECKLSNAEIEQLLGQLQAIAEVVIEGLHDEHAARPDMLQAS